MARSRAIWRHRTTTVTWSSGRSIRRPLPKRWQRGSNARCVSGVHVEEVTLHTPDGWVLGADLHVPAGAVGAAPVPAVVLMHTGRSDRAVFDRLAKLMARRGVAALALDWRGRGTSTNLGRFIDFTREQQQTIRRDVTAAYDHLGSLPEIDGGRLGVLGIAHGAGYGAEGALGDPRTRAVALMTAYHLLDDRQRTALESGDVAVLCVACTPNTASAGAMREVYRVEREPQLEAHRVSRRCARLPALRPAPRPGTCDRRLVRRGARRMTNLAPIVPNAADEPVSFVSRDGWQLEGVLRLPSGSGHGPDQAGRGAVLVHGSHHERDTFVYGIALPDVLAEHGIASLRFDIRGRGASRSPRSWRELTTLERRAVADDVAVASDLLRQRADIGDGHLAVVGEQDTSRAVVAAVESDPHIGAMVLLSPRLGRSSAQGLRARAYRPAQW